ncbi:MAG: DNA internalization-related competence protein ComEC/Rec2 [Anaerolineae bacterium]|nr:DNA internalization-related competence protein ComEC/Rec2 [Anaerolineales bacterium]MCQ3974608.1 DNA internalization-related competence protein ComEC/Rec2 [Anaerolineae bacterium]
MTPLIRFGLAWLAGIALAGWLNLPWVLVLLAALPALGALLLYRQSPAPRLWAITALAFLAGMFRVLFFQPVFDENDLAFYNDAPRPVRITGLVVDEPDVRDNYINLRLEAESLQQGDSTLPVSGLLLVRAPRYPERFYGDRLTVAGQLETPPVFEDFSYKDYLARFGIHSLMRRPRIELIASNQGNPFWTALLVFKTRASQTINRLLAEPYASLLNGILLGIETGIPKGLYETFNLTGTSHIIVISGSNISLIAGIFLLLGQKILGKRYAPPLAIGGIIIYTFLVGADAAVSRAAVMGCVFVLAIWVGRPGLALNSLIFSGFVLTLLNPLILADVGFQLSFTATLGLILLVPPLERSMFGLLQRLLKTERVGLAMALLNELLIVTLAAQIITGPLIVYHFGRLSLVSLLTNLLILPVQPPVMIVGGLATLAGMLWLPLGQALGWLVWLPLAWTVQMVEWTARLPFASLDLGTFPLWLLILFYAAIGAGVWSANQPREKEEAQPRFHLPEIGSASTRLWLGGTAVGALLVWLAVLSLPDGRLRVAILDVGQGDAILITTPDGRQILIDGGPTPTDLTWRLGQEMPFWDHSLDMVINTHPDADHLAGLPSLLDRYRVEQALVTDVGSDSELYREWETQLAEAALTPTIGQQGMQLTLGQGITATLLTPGPATAREDAPNNHSLVIRLEMGRISFLLTGDIEESVERNLVLEGAPLPATVLKSPHHGSKTSSSEMFLEAVNPQIVVISVGQDNDYGHPSPEVLERYEEHGFIVFRTDEQGTVEFSTDGEWLWVETGR